LFRLRHAPGLRGTGRDARTASTTVAVFDGLLDPAQFEDVADLAGRRSLAAGQAYAELASATQDRVRILTDALYRAQPRACSAILAEGSFLAGKVSPGSPAHRAVRDMHAIHRDSLVVFGVG
jgi:hypothetical protein